MIILLVVIIGGGISAWFKFYETVEDDIEFRSAIKVSHRLAGSSDCLLYVNSMFESRKNLIDARKLKFSAENYGYTSTENLLATTSFLYFIKKGQQLPREHPCAYLNGYKWQVDIVDTEFFTYLTRTERENLASEYGCVLGENACIWNFGKQFHYTPRLDEKNRRKIREKQGYFLKKWGECFEKSNKKFIDMFNPTPPSRIPVGIKIEYKGKTEVHSGFIEVVVIPTESICENTEKYGKRVIFLNQNNAVSGKECCYSDLQEGICTGSLSSITLGMTGFIPLLATPVTSLINVISGYCPEISSVIPEGNIFCKCKNRGQPVEIVGIYTPSIIYRGCKKSNYIFVNVENRNWEYNATIKKLELNINGVKATLCTNDKKNLCNLPENTAMALYPTELSPRNTILYTFSINGDKIRVDTAKIEAYLYYEIKKLPEPYYLPDSCSDTGTKYICKHTATTEVKTTECISISERDNDVEKNSCFGLNCPKGYLCCSLGGCVPEQSAERYCSLRNTDIEFVKKGAESFAIS